MAIPDTYEDFAEWREPRPAATVGDAMREFTGTPLDTLLAWFARFDRDTDAAQQAAPGPASAVKATPDELLASVRKAQFEVAQALDASYGDLPRREAMRNPVICWAGRLLAAIGALDEHLMGGGQQPADWQRAEPGPDQVARYLAHHGEPTYVPPPPAGPPRPPSERRARPAADDSPRP